MTTAAHRHPQSRSGVLGREVRPWQPSRALAELPRNVAVIIWLNGPFGIGKPSTAQALMQRLPGAVLSNPEPFGTALHLASSMHPKSCIASGSLNTCRR